MNKFKKILLGTLSVLTLGLFVGTGAKVNAADAITIDASDLSIDDGSVSGYDTTYFTFSTSTKWTLSSGYLMSDDNAKCTVTLKEAGEVTIYYKTTSNKKTISVGSNTTSGYIKESGTGNFTVSNGENDKITFVKASGFSSIVFTPASTSSTIADSVSLTFNYQYDTSDETKASKLRFIGTIDGIATATYTNEISDAYFTMDFNKVNDRKLSCSKVYSSIKNGDEVLFAAGDTKMYVVFELRNINKSNYSGLEVSDLHFVVEFNDGSSKSVEKTAFNLPEFAIE